MHDIADLSPFTPAAIAAARLEFGHVLTSCPHCAGEILKPQHHGMDFSGPVVLCAQPPGAGLEIWAWSVRCFNAHCGAAVLNAETAADAVERWNRRAAQ